MTISRISNLADGATLTVSHVDGEVIEETRQPAEDLPGFVRITTKRLYAGTVVERVEPVEPPSSP